MLLVILMMVLLIVTGTIVFSVLEGWNLIDSLYFTIITISTVGYGDLSPQSSQGRIFAIIFTFIAIGIGGYAISTLTVYIIDSRKQWRMHYYKDRQMKRLENLTGHIILCGADLVGTRIAEEFIQNDVPFVIIEPDPKRLKQALLYSHPDYFEQKIQTLTDIVEIDLSEYEDRSVEELAQMLDTAYILDDPTNDNILVKAGVESAKGLIAAMPDERDNLAIVIGGRALGKRFGNHELLIMARVDDDRYLRKMYLSGADFVRIPAVLSGLEMGLHMMNPEVGRWWYTLMGAKKANAPRIRQFSLESDSTWVGKTVAQVHQEENILSLAVKREGQFITPPNADLVLQSGDVLVVLGHEHA